MGKREAKDRNERKRELTVDAKDRTPVRKSILHEDLFSHDPENNRKVLRSVPRPNYCEVKRQRFSSDASDMCLDTEANKGENSKCIKPDKETYSYEYLESSMNRNMALTDSESLFATNGEVVSTNALPLSMKRKKSTLKISLSEKEQDCDDKKSPKNDNQAEDQICPICQEVLKDNHAFTLHIREHNASKNKQCHECQICFKQLSSASSLDRHMLVHSGERPFKCTMCHLAFTTNGNMHRHMRMHYTNKEKLQKLGSEKNENEECPPPKKMVYKTSDYSNSKTFKCPVCNKWFISLKSLKVHMECHPNEALECWKCNKVSDTYAEYKNHSCIEESQSEITDTKVHGFSDINFLDFSTNKFSLIAKKVCEENIRSPSSLQVFECSTCQKAFPCFRTLGRHYLTHECNTYCDSCKCHFTDPNECAIHLLLKHNLLQSELIPHSDNIEKDSFLAKLELHRTNFSSMQLPKKVENNTEENVSEISMNDQEVSKINSKRTSQFENSNDFADIPAIISLTSATIPNMRVSPEIATPASPQDKDSEHNSQSPVIEGSANANFDEQVSSMSNKNSDVSIENTEKDKFKCKHCHASFESAKVLRNHARSHSQTGPHSCEICSYKSVDKSTLLRHMRTHNGERPFKCSLCDYAFTTKANSYRHVKKKHKVPVEQIASVVVYNPNMFDSSSSESVGNENLGATMCKYCGTEFRHTRLLRHHLRSTSNSCPFKPFSCKNCSSGFSTKNNCIRHINQQHPELKNNIQNLIIDNRPPEDQRKQVSNILNGENPEKDSVVNFQTENTVHIKSEPEDEEHINLQNVKEQVCQENSNDWYTQETDNYSTDNQETENEDSNELVISEEDIDVPEYMDTSDNNGQENSENLSPSLTSMHENMNTNNNLNSHQNSPFFSATFSSTYFDDDDDRVSIAQSLVSLSEGVNFQVAPLDLSIRPIDLSYKTPKTDFYSPSKICSPQNSSYKSSPVCNKSITPPPAHSSYLNGMSSPISSTNNELLYHYEHHQTSASDVLPPPAHSSPLNKTFSTPEKCNSQHSNIPSVHENQIMMYHLPAVNVPLIYVPQKHFTTVPLTNESINAKATNVVNLTSDNKLINLASECSSQMKETSSTDDDKPYMCIACPSRFTIKSNRSRHIKRKHPELARPTRSRNFIPFLPESNPSKLVQHVSDLTKNRLRSVLIPKVNNSPKSEKCVDLNNDDFSTKDDDSDSSNTPSEFFQSNISVEYDAKSDFENNDLASVSSLIDTANSQVFKQYLINANVSDMQSPEKIQICDTVADGKDKEFKQSVKKGKESLKCQHCNHYFPWKSALERHLLTHSGKKPFKCLNCPLKFSTKSNLDRHIKRECCKKINYRTSKTLNKLCNGTNNDFLSNEFQNSLHSDSDKQEISPTNISQNILNTEELNDSNLSKSLTMMDCDSSSLECQCCHAMFKNESDLKHHIKEFHSINSNTFLFKSLETDSVFLKKTDIEHFSKCANDVSFASEMKNNYLKRNFDCNSDSENKINILDVKHSSGITCATT